MRRKRSSGPWQRENGIIILLQNATRKPCCNGNTRRTVSFLEPPALPVVFFIQKRADSEQVQIRSLLDWKLFQSELYTRGRIVHPEEDGCDLAADNGAVGVEGTLLVRAGQDARTIECVNFIRTLVAQLHVRDRVVGNVVERLVSIAG